jgi:hypothetical protein
METTLDTQTQSLFAELDYRENDGIEVSLLWSRATGELTVLVSDTRMNDVFELAVEPTHAREVFDHPYAYAAQLAA